MTACPGNFPVYSSAKDNDGKFGEYGKFMFDEELITWSVDGGGRLFHRPKHKFSVTNVGGVLRIRDRRVLDYRYLYYVLTLRHSEIRFDWVKKAHPSIIKRLYQEIPIPSLSEQKRTVRILDEAFEGIAVAKANAEKNLKNARAVFESYLQFVFTQRGPGWVEKPLGTLASFRNGINYTKDSKGERIKIVGVRNFQNYFDAPLDDLDTVTIDGKLSEFDSLKQDDILTVRSNGNIELIGRCVLVGEVATKISHSGFTIRIRLLDGQVLPKYLCHFMRSASSRKRLTDGGTGTNIKSLNQGMLSALEIPIAPISVQKSLVEKLESLSEESQRLESIYRQKLAHLTELKQSILKKAFAGELTRETITSNIGSFPRAIPNITPIDMHAGILAIAYQKHEIRSRRGTFGHVKAEKIAHMVEAHVGIDLGRSPVKDAAGPNDYKHLRQVEHRAEKAGYFSFKQSTSGSYMFRKLRRFDELTQKACSALGADSRAVDDLIELMVPMQTQQAEIFATVFAAWNNLLIGRQAVSDEAIVSEARENWHSDKLKIPREKFFNAIDWMKKKNIVPAGRGKQVVNREAT